MSYARAMTTAAALWHRIETVHAVTYFAPECEQAFTDIGLRGFWMGYFAGRASPMGPVTAPVVVATFFNFKASMVERAIPDAWTFASPPDILEVRCAAAASVLRRVSPDVDDIAPRAIPLLARAIETAAVEGRPLAAANRAVEVGTDPVRLLWQATTTLREHRGDGHVAVLTAAGLDGCQVHVLLAAYRQVPAERLRKARGWTDEDWTAATDSLVERGWLRADGSLTDTGRTARDDIERRTDELALPPFTRLGDATERLADLLTPLRDAVLAAAVISFPNPIGLPRSET